MENPDVVMAVAAIVSAVFAAGAVTVSLVGLIRSTNASKDAQAANKEANDARREASAAQWKMSEHLEAIAEAQAEAASAIAAGQPAPARRASRLSARLVKQGKGESLTIANVGTETVTIVEVSVDADIAVGNFLQGLEGVELDPGEDTRVPVALHLGVSLPVRVGLRWEDGSGIHEREQHLMVTS